LNSPLLILLLFLLVFGIFQFGWLMYIKNTLNNAARAGVRQAVVTSTLNDLDYPDFEFRDDSDLRRASCKSRNNSHSGRLQAGIQILID
jgi:Flp pilus assembly protein TadG